MGANFFAAAAREPKFVFSTTWYAAIIIDNPTTTLVSFSSTHNSSLAEAEKCGKKADADARCEAMLHAAAAASSHEECDPR